MQIIEAMEVALDVIAVMPFVFYCSRQIADFPPPYVSVFRGDGFQWLQLSGLQMPKSAERSITARFKHTRESGL